MNFQGKITFVSPVATGVSKQSGKEWASLNLVVTNDQDRYPRSVCFRLFGQEKINETAPKVGEYVVVDFDIDAREYNDRWFNEINAWRVTRIAAPVAQPQPQPQPQQYAPQQAPNPLPAQNNSDEKLPF